MDLALPASLRIPLYCWCLQYSTIPGRDRSRIDSAHSTRQKAAYGHLQTHPCKRSRMRATKAADSKPSAAGRACQLVVQAWSGLLPTGLVQFCARAARFRSLLRLYTASTIDIISQSTEELEPRRATRVSDTVASNDCPGGQVGRPSLRLCQLAATPTAAPTTHTLRLFHTAGVMLRLRHTAGC